MNLDPRTLLFSLILTYGLAVLSMFVASLGRNDIRARDGMEKWAAAMFLETVTWALIGARGTIPDFLSIIVANALMSIACALILAAIFEFQRRRMPRWQFWVPIVFTVLMATALRQDIHGRFIWGSLIYGFQMALVCRALLSDPETRAGRAWKLMFGGIVMLMLVLGMRAVAALSGHLQFAEPQNNLALHPVQLVTYIAVMSTALLGSFGFVLLVKERTDGEIMHLAMTDSLTQIPNRRALMGYAEHALARRSGEPLAILMIDLDHFKNINDTHGHLKGDEVLRTVANVIAGRLRGQDLFGRYGGEEFLVIAPDTGAKDALALAETLREIIAATPFYAGFGKLPVSVSIGVSSCPANVMRKLDEVLAEADIALYDAKQSGRNKVVSFGNQHA